MKIKSKHNQGFTLIELVVYIAGLLVLGSVLSMLIVQFYSIYKEVVFVPRADRTGLLIMDRITKEIRSAQQIDVFESQFNVAQGVLDLDSVENGVTVEKKFYVENGIVKYQENSQNPVELSLKDFTVSNFAFTRVQTPISDAIHLDLELQFQTKNATETRAYSGFAIIRESYE